MAERMKVAIRLRPLSEKEKTDNLPLHWRTNGNAIFQIDPLSARPKSDGFTFDYVFGESESNTNVFVNVIKPILDASMQGFNGTVFAYGQTSSGKTFTMSGSTKDLGVIPLAINYIFYSIENTPGREFLLRVSYMEIYNEKVNDLLEIKKKNLKLHEDSSGQVVVDVEERVCKSSHEVMEEKYKGDKNRRIGETNMNERSSRSHTIFRIIIESRNTDDEDGAVKVSHVNLVDLAGSERAGQSGATGDRFKEGCHINSSLTTLGLVINQLSEGQEGQFVNFRDSKLTRLLQSSLGGNAMTVIICAVTPAAEDQTLNTINFALRAKKIKVTPILNEVLSDAALIKRYKKQIAKLSQELEDMKNKNITIDVKEMEYKLREKEELNERLTVRIDRLKEALIVSSSSPVQLQKSKARSRSRRRMTWGGQSDRRSLFQSTSPPLGTIAEDTIISLVPQANSTRLDEIICPFEKFELELMKSKSSIWIPDEDDTYEDAKENVTVSNGISKSSEVTIQNDYCSPDMVMPFINPNIKGSLLLKDPETPPAVLREKINLMSNTLSCMTKDYEELKEYTTLERQLIGNEYEESQIVELVKHNASLTQQNATLQSELDEKSVAYDCLEKKYNEVNAALNEEIEKNISKNDVDHLEKEMEELKEHNIFLQTELKLKSQSYTDLRQQFDELNDKFSTLQANNSEMEKKYEQLQKNLQVMEKRNLDLEVTLDLKRKNSVERESELERELQNAWEALEKRKLLVIKSTGDVSTLLKRSNLDTDEKTFLENSKSLDETSVKDHDAVDYMSAHRECGSSVHSSDVDVRFVSCNTSLVTDQSITNTLPLDPLQSFCLSDSMLPVNVMDTPRKTGNFIEVQLEHKGNEVVDELSLLKDENNKLIILLETLKAKHEDDINEYVKSSDKLQAHILHYSNLMTEFYSTLNVDRESDVNNQQLKDYIAKSKTIEEGVIVFQNEIEELTMKLEQCGSYLNEIKAVIDTEKDGIEYSDIPQIVISLKEKITNLEKLNKEISETENQNKAMMEQYNEQICKLKNDVAGQMTYNEMIERLCTDLSAFMNIQLDVSKIYDAIKDILQQNNDLKEKLDTVNDQLQCKQVESDREKVILNDILELLKQEVKESLEESEITIVLKSIICSGKQQETNIAILNSEVTKSKSSELLLDEICSMLRENFGDSDLLSVKKMLLSLLNSKLELDNINANMPSYQENETIVNNLCSLLNNEKKIVSNKYDLFDSVSSLISDNINLKEQLSETQESQQALKKEYMLKVEEIKRELEDAENVLTKMYAALKDKLETDISKSNVVDTVITLAQYKEKYNRMSVNIDQQKDFSDTINNLQDILKEDINENENKIEDIVATLKKNNVELKKQLQDESKISLAESELQTEISSIKAELEANKLYETIVNDVCSVLNDEQNDSEQSVSLDKVKNAVVSLKESNAELKKRLDNLQNINIESENQYKSETDMLKSELQTGKVYESVMNDLLYVLQDVYETGHDISQDVKSAVLTLKENNIELKNSLEELKNTSNLKESHYLAEIEKLNLELSNQDTYKTIVNEVCFLLQDGTQATEKDEIINSIKRLKNINKELKESLDELRNSYTNTEMMLTEIDMLKTEAESNKECREILNDLCDVVQGDSEQIISKNDLKNAVLKIYEISENFKKQLIEHQDLYDKMDFQYLSEIQNLKVELERTKSYEAVVKDSLHVLQKDNVTDLNELKIIFLSLKEDNDRMKQLLENTKESSNETEIQFQQQIDVLKSEIESGKAYETVMDDLLEVLQETSEHSVAKDNVKIAVINLKESNLELKRLLEQVQGASSAKESQLVTEIEQLKSDLNDCKTYEMLINELLSFLRIENDDLTSDKVLDVVQSLKNLNDELLQQIKEVRIGNEAFISEINFLKEENESNKTYKNIVNELCKSLQLDPDYKVEEMEIVNLVLEMKNHLSLLNDQVKELENEYKDKEKDFLMNIENLNAELECRIESENIITKLCTELNENMEKHLSKNDLESAVIDLKELKIKFENVSIENESKIILLQDKIKEHETVINELEINLNECTDMKSIVTDLCTILGTESKQLVSQNDLKSVVIKLCEDGVALKNQITELQNTFSEKEKTFITTTVSLENDLKEVRRNFDLFVSELSQILHNENDGEVNKEGLKDIVSTLKNNNCELKRRLEELKNLKNELQVQYKTEVDIMMAEIETYKPYKELVNELCYNFGVDTSDNGISSLQSVLIELKKENSEYKVQLDEAKEKYASDTHSLESELIASKAYEEIVNEIRSIVFEDSDDSVSESTSLKNYIFSLKAENAVLKNELSETTIAKKLEIDNLREKLETYTECVDICYNLCALLNDVSNKKILKHEIKDVTLQIIKENTDLHEQLNNIKSSFDINSYNKNEIERLETKLREVSECESIINNICSDLKKHLNADVNKEQLVEYINQLHENNKCLQKDLENERTEKMENIGRFKDEIFNLENTCALLKQYEEMVNKLYDSFEIDEKTDKDIINSYIYKLKSRTSALESDLTCLKEDYDVMRSSCKSELEELRVMLESYQQYGKVVNDIFKLNIFESNDLTMLVDSVLALKVQSDELKKELDEVRSVNNHVTAGKEAYDLIFDGIKSVLGLECDFQETEITNVIQGLKMNLVELQNKLLSESENKDKFEKLCSEYESAQTELNEFNGFFNSLKVAILENESSSVSKAEILNAAIFLKENNARLNEQLISLESTNENIITKLNTANEELKNKLQICNESDSVLSDLIKYCNENIKDISVKEEILEAVITLKADHAELNNKLKSENEHLETIESSNKVMQSEIDVHKSNEDAVIDILKTFSIASISVPTVLSVPLVEDLKNYCVNLQKKTDENLIGCENINKLKIEFDNLKKLIPCKVISQKLTTVDSNSTDVEKLSEILEDLKAMNQNIENTNFNECDITKKLLSEIRNLKPSFDVEHCEESSVMLLEKFISLIMEKESEIVMQIQTSFENDSKKMEEKIKQLRGENDKLKLSNKELGDTITNLNEVLTAKSLELETLHNKHKSLQDELKEKSEELSVVKEKLLETENNVMKLRLELSEVKAEVEKAEEIDSLKSKWEELKNELSRKDVQINVVMQNILDKQSEITELQNTIQSKESQCEKLLEDLKEVQAECALLAAKVSELEKCKEIHGNVVSELKIKLDEKSAECSDLKSSLITVKNERATLTNKLENSSKESNQLLSRLEEVTQDLETTKMTLHDLMENTKAEQLKSEKERNSFEIKLEEKNIICQKLESELSCLKNSHEVATNNLKSIESFENKITELAEELDKEKREKDKVMQQVIEMQEALRVKDDLCEKLQKNINTLAQEMSLHRDTITKLKIELKSREEETTELKKINVEKLNIINNLERDLKFERQHIKKLRIKNESLMRKLEKSEQKENLPNNKSFSPNSSYNDNSSAYVEKLKKFEKELFSVFDPAPKSLENALQLIQGIVEKVKSLESQLSDAEFDKSNLDKECEDMNDHIKHLDEENAQLYAKEKNLIELIDNMKTELDTQRKLTENFKASNEVLDKDINLLHEDNEKLKYTIKEMRNDKKLALTAVDKKPLDLSTSSEFQSLKNRWEQISKATPSKDCKCEELVNTVKELKLDLTDKSNKIAMLEIQIQGENFPYKKKAMHLEEALNESKTKIMTLKQEVRRLQSCLHEVTMYRDCETGSSKQISQRNFADVATQISSSFDSDHEGVSSGTVQKQSVKVLQERVNKMERETVLLKRLCRDRNKRIESLEVTLKSHGITV